MAKSPKKPAKAPKVREDVNTLAARIVAEATGQKPKTQAKEPGRRKGGPGKSQNG